ncbi:MAG: DUF4338 domain-containing protein [Candidatus Buchananbacteria bacterium]|nr:DUF4338 domain-containing protein [Candidatus Buchananbacteria bacterium]
MSTRLLTKIELKEDLAKVLLKQGYRVKNSVLQLRKDDRESKRQAHLLAKAERIIAQENFILKNISLIEKSLINGCDLDVSKIKPKLILVEPRSEWEKIFRWWSLVWWSLPNERSYGRQMRFIVWDSYHKAPIGLIGLQSPILSWSVRDSFLKIKPEKRDYWVNQSLSAQRLGALPPYNDVLGGKLVASLLTSNVVRNEFERKYRNAKTVMKNRKIPPRLLFITTTGAYGKSSIYSRLKFGGREIVKFIGYSHGVGSFHIPNYLYDNLIKYLASKDIDTSRGYGSGPSRKLRLIDQSMSLLGFKHGTKHDIKRGVYIFELTTNLEAVISKGEKPKWVHRSVKALSKYWMDRWGIPRSQRDNTYLNFNKDKFITQTIKELEGFKKSYKNIRNA